MNGLKPCPFCGSESAAIRQEYVRDGCAVACNECKAAVGWFYTAEDATKAWNLRADGWIPVSERLPEAGDSYLVVIKEKDIFKDRWIYEVDVASSHGSYIDDFWDTFNDWCEGQEVHVTHWMPLPAPPDEVLR